jgi:hypothetical protein
VRSAYAVALTPSAIRLLFQGSKLSEYDYPSSNMPKSLPDVLNNNQ